VQSASAVSALVDVEVYGPDGTQVYTQSFDDQVFTAGQARSVAVSWTPPTSALQGTYTVKVGVFSVGWGTVCHWNNAAAMFTVTHSAAIQIINFDGLSPVNRTLNGQYPSGVIDWGGNAWYLSGPHGAFRTNSMGFNGSGRTSGRWRSSVRGRWCRLTRTTAVASPPRSN